MQQEPNVGFWNTCYNAQGITACATFGAGIDANETPNPDAPFEWQLPNLFSGGWGEPSVYGSEPFRLIAWGMKWPTSAQLVFITGEDAMNGPPGLVTYGGGWTFGGGWTGFDFIMAYNQEWDFTVGGPHHEPYHWQGYWIDGVIPSLAGTTFAWRGETEDHSRIFDCIQAEAGSTHCQDFTLSATTVTPEPSTLALLLTGFALVALVRRYGRHVVS